MKFTLRMAARALRADAARLWLVGAASALGLAAFITTAGFGESVRDALRRNARELLGADVVVSSVRPLAPEFTSRLSQVAGVAAHTRVTDTVVMVAGGARAQSRLCEVRAIEDGYPLLGAWATEPMVEARALRDDVLVEAALARAWGLRVGAAGATLDETALTRGEALRIGGVLVRIAGIVVSDDGREGGAFALGPRLYLRRERAAALGLIGARSRLQSKLFLRLRDELRSPEQARPILGALQALIAAEPRHGARKQTFLEPPANLARPIGNLNLLLDQVGLGTLALSILGAFAALSAYLRGRTRDVAVLRTLGAPVTSPTWTYGLVAGGVVAGAVALGLTLGAVLGALLPRYLSPLLPVALRELSFSFPPALDIALAAAIVLALTLAPLLRLQTTRPAAILRDATEDDARGGLWRTLLAVSVALALAAWLVHRRASAGPAAWMLAAGIAVLGAALVGVASVLVRVLSRVAHRLPISTRLAAGELSRPRSLAGFTMGILSAAVFLSLVAEFARTDLLAPLTTPGAFSSNPNLYFVDLQSDQVGDVRARLREATGDEGLHAPVVRARLSSIAGVPVEGPRQAGGLQASQPTQDDPSGWKTREQNLTYRDALVEGETLLAGRLWSAHDADIEQFSLEVRFATRVGARLGDTLVFDVQGIPLRGRVTSLRRVTWQNMRPNFFIVAPTRLLQSAPSVSFLAARVVDEATRDRLQREVTSRHPNVTVIDATHVARRVAEVLALVGTVTQALSLLMALSALAVLAATLVASRARRARDIALLRTLGAPAGLLGRALFQELLLIGGLGGGLGAAAAFGLAHLMAAVVFDLPSRPSATSALIATGVAVLLAWLIGGASIARVLRQKVMRSLGEG